jgi:hypothetical protein
MRAKPVYGACKHCTRDGQLWRRGLCARCYDTPDVRAKYPPMTKEEAGKLGASRAVANKPNRVASFGDREYMPVRVYAVVRIMRSAISGVLPVLLKWFPERDKAMAFARKHAREFTLRVYEWVGTGDSWHEGIGRRMIQTRVAVVRRRVAA